MSGPDAHDSHASQTRAIGSEISLEMLLKTLVQQGGSDLHLSVGSPAQIRVHGRMNRIKMPPLTTEQVRELCLQAVSPHQREEFESHWELDFAFSIRDLARFRANYFHQKGAMGAVFRVIPAAIPEFETLGLPHALRDVIHKPSGLVLVTGPTGSGKSTTLASLIDVINREQHGHILTLEDPIEFVHPHKNCVVNQREIGADAKSFASALRRVLRQDPDYVLVGEMRDLETVEMALTLAETGHLVFGTLHTHGAIASISRIINIFEPHRQHQVRQTLSFVLQAVFSQALITRPGGEGRVLAGELLIPNTAIRSLIREDKLHQVYASMQSGQGDSGMVTFNQSLISLVRQHWITLQDALEHSLHPEEILKQMNVTVEKKGR